MQALPPRYVRRVTLNNMTTLPLTFAAQFQQRTQQYTVAPGGSAVVEGIIDHGDWQACDPVTKITVKHGDNNALELGSREFSSDAGVKILTFNVTGDSNGVIFEETNNQE